MKNATLILTLIAVTVLGLSGMSLAARLSEQKAASHLAVNVMTQPFDPAALTY